MEKAMHTDSIGRQFSDDLTEFMLKYLNFDGDRFCDIRVPKMDAQHFCEGVTGIVLYRNPPFQVQLFLFGPNVTIPPHAHPNVDSYEVYLRGFESFTLNGEIVLEEPEFNEGKEGLCLLYGVTLRVKEGDFHGGKSCSDGGAFLSIQKWLNGIPPSSVGNDWIGTSMGTVHDGQIKKGE